MSQAYSFGQMVFGLSFNFGVAPIMGSVQTRPELGSAQPINPNYSSQQTEAAIVLRFLGVTAAKAEEFKALEGLKTRPLFLYDEDGDIWQHKLEHVMLESFSEIIRAPNVHDITLNCKRLKHYG